MPVYRYNHGLPKNTRRGALIERRILGLLALAVLGGAVYGAYLRRQDIRDAYTRWQNSPIPEPVSWADASTTDLNITKQPAFVPPTTDLSAPPNLRTSAPSPTADRLPPATKGPTTPPPSLKPLPPSANLRVPFIPQAPKLIWDAVHEDACEESSALMAQAYYAGEKTVSADEAERRILDLVAYEKETLGYFESTDAETTAKFMREKLGLTKARALPLHSADEIKRKIAAGHPVLLPADGRALKNPNFRRGGPIYHMVVVKGYLSGKFITNDPGTRKGADYVYAEEVLMGAVADWIGGDVDRNKKMMIVAD